MTTVARHGSWHAKIDFALQWNRKRATVGPANCLLLAAASRKLVLSFLRASLRADWLTSHGLLATNSHCNRLPGLHVTLSALRRRPPSVRAHVPRPLLRDAHLDVTAAAAWPQKQTKAQV